ncbi:CusA/CzcA family heavy metal efflux RND transporter [Mucilaginibacter mali]|uniref:CusA/CzcA family heavy metal efflux RND transporter n=1 Tax=Mucilaginibacter mali TaxID=2740462 RepID=A0A7D4TSI1_9SPHI|nr:CusA/CzcA family heavy metal efflux RND transporter [Mucilaginibacter mali]QKJ32814.1 CusA/CzcA family heavy metal efflux RND transporter [Mucilaginibacter mali]
MFDRIISFSVQNKVTVGILTLLLVITGAWSAINLPVDAQPDITNNQVQIITQAPTLGAQEVEQYITAPIELAMANIAGIIEKRSISRSGISVITLVFKDNIDIYWARQQVGAQLKEAEDNIPQGVGEPSLAPITTGLGEIYQYSIHAKKGYEQKYTATDLRTLQDWLVRTQLAGTVGVAEVSGWGGYVKEYEVALDNDKLNSFGVTIPDVYAALEKNNENTGGSYIEQQSNAYFIRGLGQVKNLDDIRKIVIKGSGGTPILVRDVAAVQMGTATRYGAVTRNGEGEVVAGVTLMLKGENFSQVIKNVKERMVQIQRSLPEGIVIEPFIDRTELVGRAIDTVKRNLLEGALIVVFVLVLLLGNLRAGLVVASVIPLSMLFAFMMMKLFGVSGNLMSLGAIDFGLIVDGAVIIVESVVHHITAGRYTKENIGELSRDQMNEEVHSSAGKLMQSAAFGQIIILIVYLPLLSLVGIEGKMFRPMAETVAFAILGAFILSLTYVPMASALFLSRKTTHKPNISDHIIGFCQLVYHKALVGVLRFKVLTVAIVFAIFAIAIWAFSRMGGEFIPTLEEGDLTVEISMMQGTSLSEAVKSFSKAERLLRANFPEIKQAVTRIGSSEIPTDPMPMERGDMMLAMKLKSEWKTAKTRGEMTAKMEAVLSGLPGIHASISQPMQMRFNELMTGIRQDVAIKIYGDDLDELAAQADKIAASIRSVKGVADPFVEKVSGLPQIQVNYNRDKMAQYGLNISDVNTILKTAFAGSVAGVVFEGEKRFNMVVRLNRGLRENISSVQNLLIPLASGNKVPLNQVADIDFREAPSQISREDGKRRIYVGFNVNGRDVQSTVTEIQQKLDKNLQLPSGYYLSYGGQFQNLQAARARLSVAVPAALLFILILLYVTFRSVKESLLIFTAVPLASIGGIAALLIRDMPFSISAGVGFIALFGVAVLNGIVLIGYFNQLKAEGVTDIYQRVLEGTRTRLRPVLMTAAVASLGFLPMALSSSAGAEVQKPLATVVIGGLITATFLTLFVLPCLYLLFNSKAAATGKIKRIVGISVIGLFLFSGNIKAQTKPSLTLDSAISLALQNNLQVRSANLSVEQYRAAKGIAFDLPKTELMLTQDPTSGGNIDNGLSVSQNIAWPGLYNNQRKLADQQIKLAEHSGRVTKAEITRQVRSAWYAYQLSRETMRVLNFQDSIYNGFVQRAAIRVKTGEASNLELISAKNKYQEVQALKIGAQADLGINELALHRLMNTAEPLQIAEGNLAMTLPGLSDTINTAAHPQTVLGLQEIEVAKAKIAVERSKLMPDITLGYTQQLLVGGFNPANIDRSYSPGTRVGGFQVGLALPVFSGSYRARIKSEKIGAQIAEVNLQQSRLQLSTQYQQELQQYRKFQQAAAYYTSIGLKQADEQLRIAQVSFRLGEIGYIEYIQNISAAIQTRLNYLETLSRLDQSAIQLQFYQGK